MNLAAVRDSLLELTADPARVERYYLPIAAWVLDQRKPGTPFVLGISGPQGSGKSTLASALVHAFCKQGLKALTCSADDFYLTRVEQLALAQRHPKSRALAQRGYPGTHDVGLGARVLEALRAGRPTTLPRYDKSAHEGLGDRAPERESDHAAADQDVVIFEGWTLGFVPVPSAPEPMLVVPNELLSAYASWTTTLDALLLLEAESASFIVDWRVESERRRRERGEATMSEAAAKDYIERCLPAYRCWVPPMVAKPPVAAFRHVRLGHDRLPL